MSEPTMSIKLELHKRAARMFVLSKERMPADKYELMEWLMEFTEEMGRMLSLYGDVMLEQANVTLAQSRTEGSKG